MGNLALKQSGIGTLINGNKSYGIVTGTISGLRISNVAGAYFIDNCAALLPYSGCRVRFKDSGGKYFDCLMGLRGVVESLGTIYTGDFSGGVDGWTGQRGTITGNVDGIAGVNDCLSYYASIVSGAHYVTRTLSIGAIYSFTFDYYIPSTNTNVDGIKLSMAEILPIVITTASKAWNAVGQVSMPVKVVVTTSSGATVGKWVMGAVPADRGALIAKAVLGLAVVGAADYVFDQAKAYMDSNRYRRNADGTYSQLVDVPGVGPDADLIAAFGLHDDQYLYFKLKNLSFKYYNNWADVYPTGYSSDGFAWQADSSWAYGKTALGWTCILSRNTSFYYRLSCAGGSLPVTTEYRSVTLDSIANKLQTDLEAGNVPAQSVVNAAMQVLSDALSGKNDLLTTNPDEVKVLQQLLAGCLTAEQLAELEAASVYNVLDTWTTLTDVDYGTARYESTGFNFMRGLDVVFAGGGSAADDLAYFKNIIIKQVLTPSANGLLLQSAPTVDSGFTYNAASYTYEIWS